MLIYYFDLVAFEHGHIHKFSHVLTRMVFDNK